MATITWPAFYGSNIRIAVHEGKDSDKVIYHLSEAKLRSMYPTAKVDEILQVVDNGIHMSVYEDSEGNVHFDIL